MPVSSLTSGMTDSFHQTLPKSSMPPGVSSPPPPAPSPTTKPLNTAAAPPPSPVSGFSSPVQAKPVTTPQPPKSTSLPVSFALKIPSYVAAGTNLFGGAQHAYQQATNWGALSGIKSYLGNPTNFANILGAMSPIASPLMRTAGMPLLLGAYSALRDPGYANELSGGRLNKMVSAAAAIPRLGEGKLDFRPPDILGSMSTASTMPQADAARLKPPSVPGLTNEMRSDPAANARRVGGALELGSTVGGYAANKMIRNPVASGLAGRAIGGLGSAYELSGLPETLAGKPQRAVRDIITNWQQGPAMQPVRWLQEFGNIHRDPNTGVVGKGLNHLINAVNNPVSNAIYNPVMSAASAVKGLDELTGASNLAHYVTGGKIGTPAYGNTLSVPAALMEIQRAKSRGEGRPAGLSYR